MARHSKRLGHLGQSGVLGGRARYIVILLGTWVSLGHQVAAHAAMSSRYPPGSFQTPGGSRQLQMGRAPYVAFASLVVLGLLAFLISFTLSPRVECSLAPEASP